MPQFLDPDIEKLQMLESEKAGLQVFRNYSKAFEQHRARKFAEEADQVDFPLLEFTALCKLIVSEQERFVPVIACAYGDDLLKAMYQREIPLSVPGGRGEMLSGLGPLSALAQRIQVAYAFSWLSEDILEELNHLRKLRNDISHRWDVAVLKEGLDTLIRERQRPIEETLADDVRLPKDFHKALDPVQRFRVRILWVMGRLTYETRWWVPAVKAKLDPVTALYGSSKPSLLGKVADVCVEATKEVCASQK